MVNHSQSPLVGGIRRGPRLTDRFTILDNSVINDNRLSYRARGILAHLLSKPENWRTRSESIAADSPREGRESVRTALRELAELGYLVGEKVQDPATGRWSTIQTIHEVPITEAELPVAPRPSELLRGEQADGDLGALTKDEAPRTKTNHNPRRHRPDPMSLLSSKTQAILAKDTEVLAELERQALAAGLSASFGRMTKRGEILAMVDLHGVPALVEAAKRAHRPEHPTAHVHGWLRLWKALPVPRTAPRWQSCGQCDAYGWMPEVDGNAVRSSCRNTLVSGGAR